MSKRAEEKERLARKLDAGELSQAAYDERMARMGHRGAGQQARHHAVQEAARPQVWQPGAEPAVRRGPKLHGERAKVPLATRIAPAAIAELHRKAARAGLPLAQALERAIAAWVVVSTQSPPLDARKAGGDLGAGELTTD